MKVNQNQSRPIKLIYNPNAGKKRKIIGGKPITIDDIKVLFEKYQIPVDIFITKGPGDALGFAQNAAKEKYEVVVAAGGDGTVSEVMSGLIETNIVLGILPLGSFMNTAKMLSIPHDLEKAIMLLKINRKRKIDVGQINILSGLKPKIPLYFMENSSVGIEAELMDSALKAERGKYKAFFNSLKSFFEYYKHRVRIVMDDKTIVRKITMVAVSNGQFTGVALEMAPKARLNDHKLTVSVFEMSKKELIYYFLRMLKTGKTNSPKVFRYKSSEVKIYTRIPKPVHADGQVFGTTPVVYKILPNALEVITGFPESDGSNLEKRTTLDP